jgi:integrase
MAFNKLSVYFYVKPSTIPGKQGVLVLRVTVNGKQICASLPMFKMFPEEFNSTIQQPTDACMCAKEIMMFIHAAHVKIRHVQTLHDQTGIQLTRETLKSYIPEILSRSKGEPVAEITFPSAFEEYIKDQEKQVGLLIAEGTFKVRKRYGNLYTKVLSKLNFLHKPLGYYTENDIEEIKLEFLRGYAKGTVGRAMFVFGHVFENEVMKGRLPKNPCKTVKKVKLDRNTNMIWLEPEELQALTDLELDGIHEKVRDAFVFCSWTGMSFGDFQLMNPDSSDIQIELANSPKNMEPAKIVKSKDGLMLIGRRRKTGTEFRVPLSREAKAILSKYGGIEYLPYEIIHGHGAILNLLMKLIRVNKKVRFHTARKTMANYLLNVKMMNPLYAVDIMGWKKIEEANAYVTINNSSLHRAMSSLS